MKKDSRLFNVFDITENVTKMKQNVCFSVEKEVLDYIDAGRGDRPRSRVIESLIKKGMEIEKDTSYTQEDHD